LPGAATGSSSSTIIRSPLAGPDPAAHRVRLGNPGRLERAGIRGEHDGVIDHIELFADDDRRQPQLVLCPGKAWDRSPCGTGTSAKLACLAGWQAAARGNLAQASIIGSEFTAHFVPQGIIPTIRGEAWVCGDNRLILNPDDPFCWGIAP
jgi:4-hydroxyproline epimerase